jgi:serine/threonine protein kinase
MAIYAGSYLLEQKIGVGGMGEVWLGRDPAIDKRVAIKVLNQAYAENQEVLSRFIREGKAVNQINHPHIVDIFLFGQLTDGRPFYAMELLEGISLRQFITEKAPVEWSLLCEIIRQISQALDAAHQKRIAHRDLKPENIFLVKKPNDELFVKLLDFGIAKLLTSEDHTLLTRPGTSMGTPAYMSPEQCKGEVIDHRSDVYSLGVILFELATSKLPFGQVGVGSQPMSLMVHHTITPPPLASSMTRREIPKAFDDLLMRTLAKKAAERPQTCGALYADLLFALGSNESADGVTRSDTDASKPLVNVLASAPLLDAAHFEEQGDIHAMATAPLMPPVPTMAPLQPTSNKALSWVMGSVIAVAVLGFLLMGIFLTSLFSTPNERPSAPSQIVTAAASKTPAVANIPKITVTIQSTPDGAIVSTDTDGKNVIGKTTLTFELPQTTDSLDVYISKEGYGQEKRTLKPQQKPGVLVELTAVKTTPIKKIKTTTSGDDDDPDAIISHEKSH